MCKVEPLKMIKDFDSNNYRLVREYEPDVL